MTEQNIFDPENIRNAVEKRSLLDEFNLPPQVVKFIRANARNLQIGLVCLVVVILGWTSFDAYRETRRSESATMLAQAMKETDAVLRGENLDKVIEKYSGSDAALWGKIEKANIAYEGGSAEEAIAKYEQIMADLPSDSPQMPLMQYSLGVAYENVGNVDKAMDYYKKVVDLKGFSPLSLVAMGRIEEQRGDKKKALEYYQKADQSETVTSQVKAMLASKLNSLQKETVPPEM